MSSKRSTTAAAAKKKRVFLQDRCEYSPTLALFLSDGPSGEQYSTITTLCAYTWDPLRELVGSKIIKELLKKELEIDEKTLDDKIKNHFSNRKHKSIPLTDIDVQLIIELFRDHLGESNGLENCYKFLKAFRRNSYSLTYLQFKNSSKNIINRNEEHDNIIMNGVNDFAISSDGIAILKKVTYPKRNQEQEGVYSCQSPTIKRFQDDNVVRAAFVLSGMKENAVVCQLVQRCGMTIEILEERKRNGNTEDLTSKEINVITKIIINLTGRSVKLMDAINTSLNSADKASLEIFGTLDKPRNTVNFFLKCYHEYSSKTYPGEYNYEIQGKDEYGMISLKPREVDTMNTNDLPCDGHRALRRRHRQNIVDDDDGWNQRERERVLEEQDNSSSDESDAFTKEYDFIKYHSRIDTSLDNYDEDGGFNDSNHDEYDDNYDANEYLSKSPAAAAAAVSESKNNISSVRPPYDLFPELRLNNNNNKSNSIREDVSSVEDSNRGGNYTLDDDDNSNDEMEDAGDGCGFADDNPPTDAQDDDEVDISDSYNNNNNNNTHISSSRHDNNEDEDEDDHVPPNLKLTLSEDTPPEGATTTSSSSNSSLSSSSKSNKENESATNMMELGVRVEPTTATTTTEAATTTVATLAVATLAASAATLAAAAIAEDDKPKTNNNVFWKLVIIAFAITTICVVTVASPKEMSSVLFASPSTSPSTGPSAEQSNKSRNETKTDPSTSVSIWHESSSLPNSIPNDIVPPTSELSSVLFAYQSTFCPVGPNGKSSAESSVDTMTDHSTSVSIWEESGFLSSSMLNEAVTSLSELSDASFVSPIASTEPTTEQSTERNTDYFTNACVLALVTLFLVYYFKLPRTVDEEPSARPSIIESSSETKTTPSISSSAGPNEEPIEKHSTESSTEKEPNVLTGEATAQINPSDLTEPASAATVSSSDVDSDDDDDDDDDDAESDDAESDNALSDYPHSRADCAVYKFDKTTTSRHGVCNKLYCKNCYCFVCDKPSLECEEWVDNHCDAFSFGCLDSKWEKLRNQKRDAAEQAATDRYTATDSTSDPPTPEEINAGENNNDDTPSSVGPSSIESSNETKTIPSTSASTGPNVSTNEKSSFLSSSTPNEPVTSHASPADSRTDSSTNTPTEADTDNVSTVGIVAELLAEDGDDVSLDDYTSKEDVASNNKGIPSSLHLPSKEDTIPTENINGADADDVPNNVIPVPAPAQINPPDLTDDVVVQPIDEETTSTSNEDKEKKEDEEVDRPSKEEDSIERLVTSANADVGFPSGRPVADGSTEGDSCFDLLGDTSGKNVDSTTTTLYVKEIDSPPERSTYDPPTHNNDDTPPSAGPSSIESRNETKTTPNDQGGDGSSFLAEIPPHQGGTVISRDAVIFGASDVVAAANGATGAGVAGVLGDVASDGANAAGLAVCLSDGASDGTTTTTTIAEKETVTTTGARKRRKGNDEWATRFIVNVKMFQDNETARLIPLREQTALFRNKKHNLRLEHHKESQKSRLVVRDKGGSIFETAITCDMPLEKGVICIYITGDNKHGDVVGPVCILPSTMSELEPLYNNLCQMKFEAHEEAGPAAPRNENYNNIINSNSNDQGKSKSKKTAEAAPPPERGLYREEAPTKKPKKIRPTKNLKKIGSNLSKFFNF